MPLQVDLPLFDAKPLPKSHRDAKSFADELRAFAEFGERTRETVVAVPGFNDETTKVPAFINEFWTAKQRAAHSLHEISYRACFKPSLPRFFIERLTRPGDRVYDPFMGRGTTLLEAALLGRVPAGCDVNPLSTWLVKPRLQPPDLNQVSERLRTIDFQAPSQCPEDLLVFYHPDTLREIGALRVYLEDRRAAGLMDGVDEWIGMVGLNRLTGHSPGFFSVYTLPPNQAVSVKSQRKINERRKQVPPRRVVPELIAAKSRSLLQDCDDATRATLALAAPKAVFIVGEAARTPALSSNSVQLVVTSPPFLNIVDYALDNWLRCWFVGLDPKTVQLTVPRKLATWQAAMTEIFRELARVLVPGGYIAFEVGEVHRGELKLEEAVLPCGAAAGLVPELVLINEQEFTKTANCWGVDNNTKGTNSNRIVLFRKAA